MNVLDEYLIKLGATVDASGMARFQNALRDAAHVVDSQSVSMASSFFKAQTEIVAGFTAIGGAALGLVDKVAMADQEYRLFALHMYMSKDAARSLKVAMDALGQPLENLTWDAELRDRTRQLIEDQRAMAPGGDFEEQMRKIRDIRFQFTRMEVELQYLGMHVVQDFMKALGLGPDTLLKKLQQFNTWVTHDLPGISAKLVHDFMPIWNDVERVVKATGLALYEAGVLFQNFVGLLSGDTALEGTTLSLDKMSRAIGHVADGFAEFATLIAHTELLLSHLINAMMLVSSGKFALAATELKAAGDSITTKEGMELMGGAFGFAFGGPLGAAAGSGAMNRFGTALEGGGASLGGVTGAMADAVALQMGVNPALVAAIAMQESGGHQFDKQGNVIMGQMTPTGRAIGMMQLMTATAAHYGVDPYTAQGNVTGGTAYLRDLLKHYGGDTAKAIGGYSMGQGRMDAFLAGKASLTGEARNEIAKVMGRMGTTGGVQVGSVYINITQQPGENGRDLAVRTVEALRRSSDKKVQRNLAEFNDLSWSY